MEDTQQHLMSCLVLTNHCRSSKLTQDKIVYNHIFVDTSQQKEAVVLFSELITVRSELMEAAVQTVTLQTAANSSIPVSSLDPNTYHPGGVVDTYSSNQLNMYLYEE